ncbi:MAG TPA: BatA domain-containing protein [Verrucomicrobiae bacterium]
MSFLAPLFLLGALAVALPVIFHLIRRTTREKTPFSSLMFLLPTPPRVTRRSRLENIWLLVLRCLVIVLLALGFGRPFLQKVLPPARPSDAGRKFVVLLDTSASMKRAGVWEDAVAKANAAVRNTSVGDELALFAFDRALRPVITFAEWNEAKPDQRDAFASQRINQLKPTWAATHLGSALTQAAELFDAAGVGQRTNVHRQIVLISDLQEGSRLDGLQGHEWPRGVEVVLQTVKPKSTGNAGLRWLAGTEAESKPGEQADARFRVINTTESKRDQLQLRWLADVTPSTNATPLDIYVPAGQSRIVAAPKPAPSGDARLVLAGDAETFDNSVFVVKSQPARLPILFLGTDVENDATQPLYYLRRAFPPTSRQIVEVLARKPDDPALAGDLFRAQLVVISDGLPDAALDSVKEFARNGRIVLVAMKNAAAAQTVARLLGLGDFTASEVTGNYAILGQIDFQHPLFAPFADPRFSDFTKIHFWKHRRIDAARLSGARVLAKFDDGDPALAQMPVGKGGVVILTSAWQPADSQLALSSKFVPLLHSLLELSANLPAQKAQYFIGDEVPFPPSQQPLTVHKPDGKEVPLVGATKFTDTDQPGIYAVTPAGWRFAVNLAPEESRTSPLPVDQLLALGVPLKQRSIDAGASTVQQQARLQAAELEGQQKLWRWLIVAALVVLMVETWLAGRVTNRARAASQAQA